MILFLTENSRGIMAAIASIFFITHGLSLAADSAENYKKALQMSNYFFTCQESGELSPLNQVPWRGPAHTNDGQDAGRDLAGGWYDAGDHWKSNYTMGKSAWRLAWSALTWPQAYTQSQQQDELFNHLKYICDYFLQCVADPHPHDINNFHGYEIYIDIGGLPGPSPSVHSVWASPEVIEGYIVRESLKSTPQVPAIDTAGNMAATLASCAILFDRHGNTEQKQYARQLYQTARKLGYFMDRSFERFFTHTLQNGKCMAVASDGTIREIAYRDKDPYPYCVLAFAWLHRAAQAVKKQNDKDFFLNKALHYEKEMAQKSPNPYAWWASDEPKYAAMALLDSEPSLPQNPKARMEKAVEKLVRTWADTKPNDRNGVVASPGGLHYRKNRAKAFTISVMLNPTALSCYWSAYKKSQADKYIHYAKKQIDYVLGNNPTGKSYMIGYDNDGSRPFWKVVHHRGAYGAWRSFEHFVKGKPIYRPKSVRHTLYGGVLLGNNAPDDTFQAEVMHHAHTEVAIYANAAAQSILACLIANGHGQGEPIPDTSFPPKAKRNNNTNMYTTDREFFVIARMNGDNENKTGIVAELHNRTRWPARRTSGLSFRYYFQLDSGAPKSQIQGNIVSSSVPAIISDVKWTSNKHGYVEISFPNDSIAPFAAGDPKKWSNFRRVYFTIGSQEPKTWNRENDWSNTGLGKKNALLPHIPVYHNGKLVGGVSPAK